MLNFITKHKHKVFIKNVISIIESEQYILKDYYHNNAWCMCLFINKNLFFAIKNQEDKEFNILKINSIEQLMDFTIWQNSPHYEYLKVLINKAHDKKFKTTFLIAKTDYLIEDLSTFLRERSIGTKINCKNVSEILSLILQDGFAHLYVKNEINDNNKCEGKGFD